MALLPRGRARQMPRPVHDAGAPKRGERFGRAVGGKHGDYPGNGEGRGLADVAICAGRVAAYRQPAGRVRRQRTGAAAFSRNAGPQDRRDELRQPMIDESPFADLMAQVEERLADVPEGDGMDPLDAALVRLAVSVSVTCLDSEAIDEAVVAALESGATAAQVQEVVALVSGLGVHSIMASATVVLQRAAERDRKSTRLNSSH